jgi:hypothetical protein
MVISLYDCMNAKVKGNQIYCSEGCQLGNKSIHKHRNGVDIERLKRGEPLEFKVCQLCTDFKGFDCPLPEKEKGWK